MVNSRKKDSSVETLRGMAILLVVMGHVIGSDSSGGMKVGDDSFLRYIYYTFEYLRMPLFTLISGWVYALHPVTLPKWSSFTIKKIRRILLPLVFVGSGYFILQQIIPGVNNKENFADIWKILVFPYTLYWYLPSLFLVFLIISIFDSYGLISKFSNWIIFFSASIVLLLVRNYYLPEIWPNYFSYKGAIYLLPYFTLGIGLQRYKDFFFNKYLIAATTVVLLFCLLIQQLVWFNVIDYQLDKRTGIGLLIGFTGTLFLFRLRWEVKWLIWVGSFAYTIYLFHAFGTAGGRIITKSIGVNSTPIIFMVSFLFGVLLPILTEFILDKFSLTRMLFLGRSYNKSNKAD